MSNTSADAYMAQALIEARKGLGQTSPNPCVGAVIVHQGQIIARGYHAKAGTPHAERVAIAQAEAMGFTDWHEASIYVTLEPCSTAGRTGACAHAIIDKGVAEVVYGAVDPNPAHEGRADAMLERAGIRCHSRVAEAECLHLIRDFRKVQETGLPWVIIKSAMSLDGKITRPLGEGQWLSSPESRIMVHELRSEVDAVLTGGNTVREDDPQLNVRLPGRSAALRQPLRIILTRDRQSLPAAAQLLQDPATLVYETPNATSLEAALRSIVHEHGVNSVMVEAGGGLLGLFHDAGLVDEAVIFLAPLLTGGNATAVGGAGATALSEVLRFPKVRYQRIGDDVVVRASRSLPIV